MNSPIGVLLFSHWTVTVYADVGRKVDVWARTKVEHEIAIYNVLKGTVQRKHKRVKIVESIVDRY
jgi:hypothetical protein